MSRSRGSAIAAAAACLAFAAPARADTTSIIAPDMEVDVGDAGDIGAGFVSSGFSTLLPSGEAGLQVDVNGTVVDIGAFTPDPPDPSTVTGTGAAGDPFKVVTKYHTTGLQITQTVTHVTGDARIVVGLDFKNTSASASTPRALYWGDVQGGGFGQGVGALSGGYLEGVFATQGAATGLQELTPWQHFEEADDATLAAALENPSATLTDSVDAAGLHDPAVAAEYDLSLAAGQTKHVDVAWKFLPGAANLTLAPEDGSGPPGTPACFTATVTNAYGTPVTGLAVDFAAGDPHPDLQTPTDANGQAAYCVTAAEPDEFLFVEADVTDALLSAFSTWTFTGPSSGDSGTSPPTTPQTVRARLVKGRVRVRHGTKWTALTTPRTLAAGTTLDTRHGTVALTATVAGHTRHGAFHGGVFRVQQAGPKAPVDVVLGGGAFTSCKHGSTRVVRRLVAAARGHFETVGRASTASGSGSWTTQDRCDGTLTSVQTGAVTVQSAHHHRTVVVHARHRALMKP